MVNEMMEVLLKKIPEKYPYLQGPAIVPAQVTSAGEAGEWTEECRISDDIGTREATVTHKKYRYTLQVIGDSGERDASYPAIPSVISRLEIPVGTRVAVAMLRGLPEPYILGVYE